MFRSKILLRYAETFEGVPKTQSFVSEVIYRYGNESMCIPEERKILGPGRICTNGMIRDVFKVLCWKIRSVRDGAEVRNEGSVDLSDRITLYSIEERMSLDFVHSVARFLRSDEPGGRNVNSVVLA